MKKLPILFILILIIFSCNNILMDDDDDMQENQEQLNTNKAKWASNNISSYTYTYHHTCFCPDVNTTYTITVENNSITSIVDDASNDITNLDNFKTIDELFDTIQSAVNRDVDSLTVTYNADYGYPAKIDIDSMKHAIDDEVIYFCEDLVIH